jgi:hypothetical protein
MMTELRQRRMDVTEKEEIKKVQKKVILLTALHNEKKP